MNPQPSVLNPNFVAARRLAHLLTVYDAMQSKKRSYNPHALALYLDAAHAWENNPLTERDPVASLAQFFTSSQSDATDFCLPPVRQFVRELRAATT